jgi:beta-glucosidase
MKRLLAALLCSALVMPSATGAQAQDETSAKGEATARPWMNPRLSPGERANLLVAAMTLDEKIAMLHGPMAMPLPPTMPVSADAGRCRRIGGVYRRQPAARRSRGC